METDATLLADLEQELEPKGDPMSLLKIEHRLFSFISINWRAKPLTSLKVVLELISHTTTKEGLAVTAIKDSNLYPTGIQVSEDELAALKLFREAFHGDWNYTIKPQDT